MRSSLSVTFERRRSPAVSTSRIGAPSHSASIAIESRVIPASGPTTSRSSLSSLLISVDLPALGRPTIASFNGPASSSSPSRAASAASAISGSSTGSSASYRSAMPSPCSAEICTGSPKPSA